MTSLNDNAPEISVVIPTRGRPKLLLAALRSALNQQFESFEVLVVIDGPDQETREALATIESERIVLVELPSRVGGANARNAGVENAHGRWVTFLDDDDEWLPAKLTKQLDRARHSRFPSPIVCSAVIARSPLGDSIWPRTSPRFPISEYLFSRTGWFQGEGVLQTSTLFAPRSLWKRVPFSSGLTRHQDWDWLLRACNEPDVGIEYIAEPLAVWRLDDNRETISARANWKESLDWIRRRRSLVTPRAYAGFIATQISPQAARQRNWKMFLPLLRESRLYGKPRVRDLLLYLGMWVVPPELRRRIRQRLA